MKPLKKLSKKPNFDYSVEGRRVTLVSTDDLWTDLIPGDKGTAMYWNHHMSDVLFVSWDKGSSMGLIENVDQWEWDDESSELSDDHQHNLCD